MKFLVIGTATDGPDNEVRRPLSSQNLYETYGGYYYETHNLSPSASAIVTDHDIYDFVSDSVTGRGLNQLYRPQITDNVLTFGPLGGTETLSTEIRYRPYLGKSDLITAAQAIYLDAGEWPDVCRVKGTVATLTVDDWTFRAKYSGVQYNDVVVDVTGDTMTVSGLAQYPVCTYDLTDIDEAVVRLQNDFDLNLCPIYLTAHGATAPSTGITNLSGGGNAVLDNSSLTTLMDSISVPEDISGIVVLGEWFSGMAEIVETYHEAYRPVFFLIGPTGADFSTFATASGTVDFDRHNMLGCVEGEVERDIDGVTKRRYAVEALAGAMMRSGRLQITNIPLKVPSYYPVYTEEELDYLHSIGIMGLVRKIRSGVSIYKEVTTGMEEDLVRSLIYSEIWSRTTPYCSQYMGRTLVTGPNRQIADDIKNLISDIDVFEVIGVSAEVYDNFHKPRTYEASDTLIGSGLVIGISGYVYDEILTINFSVKTK